MWSGKVGWGYGLCDELRGRCGQARWVGVRVCVMRCGVGVVRQGGGFV